MNWVKLSLLKMQGVSGIDIMYDGDEAGRTAAEKVKGTAEELGMSVQIVTLPEGTDPGGLVKDQVNRISKRLYG
jgi:DNA primase